MAPGLIISLDYELNWGYNNASLPLDQFDVEKTLNAIKALFDQYEIRSTWATVGKLLANLPTNGTPTEQDTLKQQGKWIAANLLNDEKVDFGSHSFEHLFFLEFPYERQKEDFEKYRKQVASITMESLVFPRNQYDKATLDLAKVHGFRQVRTVQSRWLLQSNKFTRENKLKQITKRFSELLPLNRAVQIEHLDEMTGISDSRFFRFFPEGLLGDALSSYYKKVIFHELKTVFRKGEMYHIWFHPHNLIVRPYRLKELESFLIYFKKLQKHFNAKSYHMKDVAQLLS